MYHIGCSVYLLLFLFYLLGLFKFRCCKQIIALNKYEWVILCLARAYQRTLPSTHHINWRAPESVSLGNMHNRWGACSVFFSQACFCFFACLRSVLTATLTENSLIARDKGQCSLDFYKQESTEAKCVFVLLYESNHDSHKQIKKTNVWMRCFVCVFVWSWTVQKQILLSKKMHYHQ